jgi:hypothetical protein
MSKYYNKVINGLLETISMQALINNNPRKAENSLLQLKILWQKASMSWNQIIIYLNMRVVILPACATKYKVGHIITIWVNNLQLHWITLICDTLESNVITLFAWTTVSKGYFMDNFWRGLCSFFKILYKT